MIGRILRFLFGDGRNVLVETGELFRPNAEAEAARAAALRAAALGQLAAEQGRRADPGWFDRLVDGLNRLPRPALAFGTIALFIHAMLAPEAFARRMEGLALVPQPLWWLLGAVISFYFGARELHYRRISRAIDRSARAAGRIASRPVPDSAAALPENGRGRQGDGLDDNLEDNPALVRWQAARRRQGMPLAGGDDNRP